MPEPAAYDERLGVPLRWWALATMFLASLLLAFLVATPVWLALVVTGVLVAVVVLMFVSYGAARVAVHDRVLTAATSRRWTPRPPGCSPAARRTPAPTS
jgi:hypothetical protein